MLKPIGRVAKKRERKALAKQRIIYYPGHQHDWNMRLSYREKISVQFRCGTAAG